MLHFWTFVNIFEHLSTLHQVLLAVAVHAHVVTGTRVWVVAPGSQKEELWLEYTCFSSAPYPHVTEIHVYAMAQRVWGSHEGYPWSLCRTQSRLASQSTSRLRSCRCRQVTYSPCAPAGSFLFAWFVTHLLLHSKRLPWLTAKSTNSMSSCATESGLFC